MPNRGLRVKNVDVLHLKRRDDGLDEKAMIVNVSSAISCSRVKRYDDGAIMDTAFATSARVGPHAL